MSEQNKDRSTDFAKSAEGGSSNVVTEFIDFIKHNKKWWMIPIIAVLLLMGLVIVVGATAAAPFIYTLF